MVSAQKTCCPHCHTMFRVSQTQLEAAAGMVRCGKCYKAFNGFECLLATPAAPTPASTARPPRAAVDDDDDFLIDDDFDISRLETTEAAAAPAASGRTVATGAPAAQPTTNTTAVPGPSRSQTAPAKPAPPPQAESPPADDDLVFPAGSPIPVATEQLAELELDQRQMYRWRPETHNIIPDAGLIGRHPSERREPLRWLWMAGAALAAVTLAVQLVFFNSMLIDRQSALWPLADSLCGILGCPLPNPANLDQILSTNLVIRNHPYTDNALLVDAVIVNTADFVQPFPPLTLAFENLQGELVAQRTFLPENYLRGELDGLAEMPAQKPVKLELEIVDPGKDAVSFRFFIAK